MSRLFKIICFVFALAVIVFLLEVIYYFFFSPKLDEVPEEQPKVITEIGALRNEIVCNVASFNQEFADFVYSEPLEVPEFWMTELEEKSIVSPAHMYRIKATVNKIWEEKDQLMWELAAGNSLVVVEVNRQPSKLDALAYKWLGDPKDKVKVGDKINVLLGAICPSEGKAKLEFYDYKIAKED